MGAWFGSELSVSMRMNCNQRCSEPSSHKDSECTHRHILKLESSKRDSIIGEITSKARPVEVADRLTLLRPGKRARLGRVKDGDLRAIRFELACAGGADDP